MHDGPALHMRFHQRHFLFHGQVILGQPGNAKAERSVLKYEVLGALLTVPVVGILELNDAPAVRLNVLAIGIGPHLAGTDEVGLGGGQLRALEVNVGREFAYLDVARRRIQHRLAIEAQVFEAHVAYLPRAAQPLYYRGVSPPAGVADVFKEDIFHVAPRPGAVLGVVDHPEVEQLALLEVLDANVLVA
nr:hypothetical protein [Tanacetum cinerariifolium]